MICGQLESDHRLSKYSLRDEKVKKTILKATGISKSFSHVPILKNVDFELDSAETHILMGENGAGKSTLMKIITGVYQQDKGNIYLDDGKGNLEEIAFSNPKMALEKGISMVFQEFNLMENMTIAENIFMGYEPVKKGLIDWNKMNQDALKWMEMVEIDAPPTELVENLSTAQKQCVEIAKCLSHNAKIIILDEPTSSLSEREVRTLFKLIAKLKKEGISIIYISHRMEEIFEIGDRVTVFRDGEKIDTLNIKDTTEQKLIQLMIGREFKESYSEYKIDENREIVLEAENVITSKYKDPISFKAYKGEITGIFGLVGAGRTELARVLFGIDRSPCGTIKKDGKVLNLKSAKDAINNKIGMVPEDRKQLGLVLKHNVQDNLTVVKLKDLPWLLKSDREEAQITDHYINALSIATRGGQQIVGRLSGGNQQKVVISKWLSLDLDVLILDEPTRGVDVKAKAEIYDIMRKLADKGVSIIMISSDLPEILRVSHRVIVMHDGKITLDGQTKDYDQEKIMHAAIS